ncbi:MAG TPA: hypothetical protein VMU83_03050 [Hanamia sp.]|nr:hypothetical protein [Hanamia sp.]
MAKVFGILKFIVALLIFAGVCTSAFIQLSKEKDIIINILAIIIVAIFSACYLYYLIKTGIWNIKQLNYKISILLIVGILIHFLFLSLLTYMSFKGIDKTTGYTVLPFSLLLLVFGLYDVYKILPPRFKSVKKEL